VSPFSPWPWGGSVENLLRSPPRAPAACDTVAGTLQLELMLCGGVPFLELPEKLALGVPPPSWR